MGSDITVPPGDPDALLAATRSWGQVGTDLLTNENSSRTAADLLRTDWTGTRADDFEAAAKGVLVETVTLRDGIDTAATALTAYANDLRDAQQTLTNLRSQHDDATRRASGAAPNDDVTVQRESLRAYRLETQAGQVLTALHASAARARAALDRETDLLVPSGDGLNPAVIRRMVADTVRPAVAGRSPDNLADAWAALAGAQTLERRGPAGVEPPRSKDPRVIAQWWAHLPQSTQDYLIANDYEVLHALRGLPATVADTLNRMQLADDKALAQNLLASLPTLWAAWNAASPEQRVNLANPITIQGNAQRLLALIGGIEKGLNRRLQPGSPPTYLLTYDPYAYDNNGRAAIAFGNPDTAVNTAVVLPGTGNNVTKFPTGDAANLYAAASKQGWGASLSVIVDLSYYPPADLVPSAGLDHYAQDGNGAVRDDLNSYSVSHEVVSGQHGHTTLIAHSYGSYTAGLALHNGLHVDDVVFIGSPGVGVGSVKDLHLTGDHVFDGRSDSDEIKWADDWFTPGKSGPGPEDPDFGATRFGVNNDGGHSDYYKQGSESLTNIARIVVGQSSSITPDH